MAGKIRYTDAQKKQVVKLREKGLSLKDVGLEMQKKYNLDNPPAQQTITKMIKDGEAILNSTKTNGEIALEQAKKAKTNGELLTESRTVAPRQQVEISNNVNINNVSSEALKNFMKGVNDSDMDTLASQLGGDFDESGDSLFDDLSNDSTRTTDSGYTDFDIAENISDIDTSTPIQNLKLSSLKSTPEFNLSNDNKYFIETLLKGQIRPIGYTVGGNLYFPSYNFGYLFQIQNATRLPNGYVAVVGGVVKSVELDFFDDKLDQGVINSVGKFKAFVENDFSKRQFGQPSVITYKQLFEKYNAPNATAYISVANILQQNKQLTSIQVLPMLNAEGMRELDLIVAMTTFGVKVLSFNK